MAKFNGTPTGSPTRKKGPKRVKPAPANADQMSKKVKK